MPKTVAVIDGNSLMHRAYHAVPPTMTAPDGTPTNAAFGFLSMLLKFIEMEQPDALVCAFDKGRPKFRMEALEQYKAQRPPMDEELKAQFPVIENLLAAMNVPVVALPGWEGDDILGTVAARDEELGYRTLLVTGDKDAYQLASDLTHIVTTKRGITDVVIYGPAEVEERYGVTPAQFTDFLGLKGDKADNIPGVPGIGDKKAASMLQAYGNLEGIYANLDKFKGKQLENLTNYKDDAFLSRQVATIVRDADFELDLESISFPDFDAEEVTKAFTEVRMMAHLAKVLKLQGGEAATADLGTWDTLLEGAEAKAALEEHTEGYLPVSWVLDSQASLFGEGLSLAVNLGDSTALFHDAEAKEALAFLIRERDIAAADAKALLQVVFPADTAKEALVSRGEVLDARIFDVTLAAYVADSNNGAAGLGALMERYAGAMLPEEKDPQKALALEAAAIGALVEPLTKELEKEEARKVYDAIDLPLVGVLACMERTGAALDVEHLKALNESTGAEVERLLRAEKYDITDNPSQAGFIIQASVLEAGITDAASAHRMVEGGYGAPSELSGKGATLVLSDILLVQRRVPSDKRPKRFMLQNVGSRNARGSSQMRTGLLAHREFSVDSGVPALFVTLLAREITSPFSTAPQEQAPAQPQDERRP